VTLSPRQEQIIGLLLKGCSNAEIATALNIAERTVKAHFRLIFARYGILDGQRLIKRVKLATMVMENQGRMQ